MAGQQTITAVITADAKPFKKGMEDASKSTATLTGSIQKVGIAGKLAFAGVAAAVGGFVVSSVKSASTLNEAGTAIKQIFGDAATSIDKTASSAAIALGQSQSQFLAAAKTFGIFGKAAGLTTKENEKFSVGLTTLATDLASFNDTSVQDAIDAIGAGLRGESEPLRRYGVLITDAALKQEALNLKISDGKSVLTSQQKILAAQSLIYKQTTTQQGDFARTSGGVANATRQVQAAFENLKATVGTTLLPSVSVLLAGIAPALQELAPVIAKVFGSLTPIFDALTAVMPSVTDVIGQLAAPLGQVMSFLAAIVVKTLPLFNKLWAILAPVIEQIIPPLLTLLDAVLTPLIDIVGQVIDAFAPMIADILPLLVSEFKALAPFISSVMELLKPIISIVLLLFKAFMPIITAVLPIFIKLLELILPPLTFLIGKLTDGLLWVVQQITPWVDAMVKQFDDFQKSLAPVFQWVTDIANGLGQIFGYSGKTVDVKATTSIWPQPVKMDTASAAPVNISVNAVSSSAETGRAVAAALTTYYRSGGRQVSGV